MLNLLHRLLILRDRTYLQNPNLMNQKIHYQRRVFQKMQRQVILRLLRMRWEHMVLGR